MHRQSVLCLSDNWGSPQQGGRDCEALPNPGAWPRIPAKSSYQRGSQGLSGFPVYLLSSGCCKPLNRVSKRQQFTKGPLLSP